MLPLFSELQKIVRETHREIAVVLNSGAGAFAVSVDSVDSVERLAEADIEAMAGKGIEQQSSLVASVAKRAKDSALVLMLAAESILDASARGELLGAH